MEHPPAGEQSGQGAQRRRRAGPARTTKERRPKEAKIKRKKKRKKKKKEKIMVSAAVFADSARRNGHQQSQLQKHRTTAAEEGTVEGEGEKVDELKADGWARTGRNEEDKERRMRKGRRTNVGSSSTGTTGHLNTPLSGNGYLSTPPS